MKWLIFFSLLVTTSLFAQSIPQILSRVSQANEMMPSVGKYRGQKIENGQRRTIFFLTPAEKSKFFIPRETVAFANFRHNGQFFIAALNGMKSDAQGRPASAPSMIDRVVLAKKHWAGKSRPELKEIEVHTELLFYFKNNFGITLLYNQNTKTQLATPQTLKSIVLSIEAVRSSQVLVTPFFPDALGPNLAIAHRLVSLYERNMQHKDDPERTLSSYLLKLGDTQSSHRPMYPAEALLAASLEKSQDLGRSEIYQVLLNNCTNNLFQIFDEELIYNHSKGGKIDYSLIKNNIVSFVNTDLNNILAFLDAYASQNQDAVDPATRLLIKQYARDYSLQSAQDLDMDNMENPQNLMYQIPAFVEGHLKARGLY